MMVKFIFLITMMFSQVSYAQEYMCFVRLEPSENRGSAGTGFFIGDNQVLTAYHVVEHSFSEDKNKVRIEYRNRIYDASVMKHDVDMDLAILNVSVDDEDIIRVAEAEPKIGDELFSYGYANGTWQTTKRRWIINCITMINQNQKKCFYLCNGEAILGMSGGPIVNNDGELVSVVLLKGMRPNIIEGYGLKLSLIKEFIKR